MVISSRVGASYCKQCWWGKFLLLTESVDIFHLGNEQKVTCCRSLCLSILGWRRRVLKTEITGLKKGRRKGQRVINIHKAVWAKPDPQKHLDISAAGRAVEGILLKTECILSVWDDQIFSACAVVLADYRRPGREGLAEGAFQSSWCLFRKDADVLQSLPFFRLWAPHVCWGGGNFLQSFVPWQVCWFSWNCLAMEIIYSS